MNRLNERAALMGQMLETIAAMKGLPAGEKAGVSMELAARRCMSCEQTEACARWLENIPDDAKGPFKACPNGDLLEAWLNS